MLTLINKDDEKGDRVSITFTEKNFRYLRIENGFRDCDLEMKDKCRKLEFQFSMR